MSDVVDEDEDVRNVVARLTQRFPEADPARLRAAALEGFDRFRDARVRDFVPVLAERAAIDALRNGTARTATARGPGMTHPPAPRP